MLFPRRRSQTARSLPTALLVSALIGLGWIVLQRDARRPADGLAVAIDGDSLRLQNVEIRLEGVDAPELSQTCQRAGRAYSCGAAARNHLARLVSGQIIQCSLGRPDRYGRPLARCSVAGQDIGARLVSDGVAVAYGDYEKEEREARAAGRNLWSGSFEQPADWRRRNGP